MRVRLALLVSLLSSACAPANYTRVSLQSAESFDAVLLPSDEPGIVRLRKTNRPEILEIERSEIARVRHPGAGRAIAGGVLSAGLLTGIAFSVHDFRSCSTESCDLGGVIGAGMLSAFLPLTTAMMVRGLAANGRSRHRLAGTADYARARRRHLMGGSVLFGAAVVLVGASLLTLALPAHQGAYSPESQRDDIYVLPMTLSWTAAIWIAMGAYFIHRGNHLQPAPVLAFSPLPGGGSGSFTLNF